MSLSSHCTASQLLHHCLGLPLSTLRRLAHRKRLNAELATIREQEHISICSIVSTKISENIGQQLLLTWRASSICVILSFIHDHHFIGIFVDAPAGRYRIYNLFGPKNRGDDFARETMDTALPMAAAREPAFTWKLNSKRLKLRPDQKQTNRIDCGVFFIAAAHNWLNNSAHSAHGAMPRQRDMGPSRSEWINRFAKDHYH